MKIICKDCGELKEYCAKGMCEKCYMEKWQKIEEERWYREQAEEG